MRPVRLQEPVVFRLTREQRARGGFAFGDGSPKGGCVLTPNPPKLVSADPDAARRFSTRPTRFPPSPSSARARYPASARRSRAPRMVLTREPPRRSSGPLGRRFSRVGSACAPGRQGPRGKGRRAAGQFRAGPPDIRHALRSSPRAWLGTLNGLRSAKFDLAKDRETAVLGAFGCQWRVLEGP